MNPEALLWLSLNLLSLAVLSFFSMIEMACVSFNRIRLQYEVSLGERCALQLQELLQNPARLFGTTLIGVNVATMFGSEFSRQFHEAIGVSPEWAPLSQVMIVIIFGDLGPMFAARRCPENTVRLGIGLLSFSAMLMTPFLLAIKALTEVVHFFFGGSGGASGLYLNQEEIKKIIEETREEAAFSEASEELNSAVSNIFNLRHRRAFHVMRSLKEAPLLPSNLTIERFRKNASGLNSPFHLIYHRKKTQIIGVVQPRDLLKYGEKRRMADCAKKPWFISREAEIMEVLEQFRRNKQSVAVVLDNEGVASGFVALQDLISEIFGKEAPIAQSMLTEKPKTLLLFEKTLPGEMRIEEFNREFHVNLDPQGHQTFNQLISSVIGHHPEKGETIFLPPFEIQVKESSLLGVKSLTIKTRLM